MNYIPLLFINIIFIYYLGFTSGLSYQVQDCNLPSKYWCLNREIAEKCEVTQACKKNVWNKSKENAQIFNFELYYESLCPDCKEFITKQLYPVYKKTGTELFNLTLVPYGNAREHWNGSSYEFTCQHGPKECLGNIIEVCGIYLIKNKTVEMAFINCMESITSGKMEHHAKKCALKAGIEFNDLQSCYTSALGNRLQHEMAVRTDLLSPTHQYVPWVVVNGIHSEKIQDEAESNLLKLFCDSIQDPKPDVCASRKRKCIKE